MKKLQEVAMNCPSKVTSLKAPRFTSLHFKTSLCAPHPLEWLLMALINSYPFRNYFVLGEELNKPSRRAEDKAVSPPLLNICESPLRQDLTATAAILLLRSLTY